MTYIPKRPEVRIPPWTIFAGFGSLKREEVCDLLAVFEDASLINIVVDRVRTLVKRGDASEALAEGGTFHRRLQATAKVLREASCSDAILRLRLWEAMREAFGLKPCLPLSTRTANTSSADIAQCAADALADSLTKAEQKSTWSNLRKRLENIISPERADFSTVVRAQAVRLLAEAARQGHLEEVSATKVGNAIQNHLNTLLPVLRDKDIEYALKTGDHAALGLLGVGGTLIGLGVAVEMAGFGAYVLAAQLAGIVPLLGGKAAVSSLFVLANPLFIVPALLGGGLFARHHLQTSVRCKLASGLAVLLAIKGLASGRAGLQHCLNDFKALTAKELDGAHLVHSETYKRILSETARFMGGALPPTPGQPEGVLARPLNRQTPDALEKLLFPKDNPAAEALAVAGLTLGDVVYHAAAIDPSVIAAADFSRAEDLADIFTFGAFANKVAGFPDAALRGVYNNLQGYVAEQVVAARLVENGHQVCLPDTSNNPGFDLLVDGAEFQVKCLSSLDGLRSHFDKYPDTPVLANAELAPLLDQTGASWADKVFFVEGYDLGLASHLMDNAIEAGAALDDVDVPIFAAAVSVAQNIHGWWQGSMPLSDLPFAVAVDGAVKGSMAAAGGFAGKALGLLIFGPAGAVVFSGIGGVGALLGSGLAKKTLNKALVGEWIAQLDGASTQFGNALRRVMLRKLDLALDKAAKLYTSNKPQALWLHQRMLDDALAVAESVYTLDSLHTEADALDQTRLRLALMHKAGIHPWTVNTELQEVMHVLAAKPTLIEVASKAAMGTGKRLEDIGQTAQSLWRKGKA